MQRLQKGLVLALGAMLAAFTLTGCTDNDDGSVPSDTAQPSANVTPLPSGAPTDEAPVVTPDPEPPIVTHNAPDAASPMPTIDPKLVSPMPE